MQGNPVVWFEIYVDDLDRAKTFYEKVLNITLNKMESPGEMPIQMLAFPDTMESYGATGALVKMDGVQPGGSGTLVYLSCEDCAIEEARAVENGGSVQMPKMSIGSHGYISLIIDTEGNTVGLHSMK